MILKPLKKRLQFYGLTHNQKCPKLAALAAAIETQKS